MHYEFAHLLTIKLYFARVTHVCTLLVQLVHLKHL